MSRISSEDAFLMLAKWSEERAAIQVVMSRSGGWTPVESTGLPKPEPAIQTGWQRAASAGVVDQVLPHSQKALLTLRDENGEDVGVTVSLEGAEWEYEDAGAVLPEFVELKWVCFLAATFPNGNRYVFGERVKPDEP